jgi:hypothetical protein
MPPEKIGRDFFHGEDSAANRQIFLHHSAGVAVIVVLKYADRRRLDVYFKPLLNQGSDMIWCERDSSLPLVLILAA